MAVKDVYAAPDGLTRVAIGRESFAELRRLSDERALSCPSCGGRMILRAGPLISAHFAHLPGAACSRDASEPETEEHIAGKRLLGDWLSCVIPDAAVTLEARLGGEQRADLLVETCTGQRFALEYQCAEISVQEWNRRHALYTKAGIRDLWILGGRRLDFGKGVLRTSKLEWEMLRLRAPLLFLDSIGDKLPAGTIARFKPRAISRRLVRGKLSVRPLLDLPFPWKLVDWPRARTRRPRKPPARISSPPEEAQKYTRADTPLLQWLADRHGFSPDTAPRPILTAAEGHEVFACSFQVWQSCLYCRFIAGRSGESWWIEEVEAWARRYLPIAVHSERLIRNALYGFQRLLAEAGILAEGAGVPRICEQKHCSSKQSARSIIRRPSSVVSAGG